MKAGAFWVLDDVSDHDLQRVLLRLLAHGARTEARIIAHLAAIEDRRLDLRAGYPSLYKYCLEKLGLSNAESYLRSTAAHLARKFPVIFSLIDQREIHLSGVCLLRDYLTPMNHAELLAEASHKTKLEILELLARRFPRPDVKSRIRKLPGQTSRSSKAVPQQCDVEAVTRSGQVAVPAGTLTPTPTPTQALTSTVARATAVTSKAPMVSLLSQGVAGASVHSNRSESAVPGESQSDSSAVAKAESPAIGTRSPSSLGNVVRQEAREAPKPFALIAPTSEARYRLQLNMSAELRNKLEEARALLKHAVPDGDLAQVVERAVDELLGKVKQRRFGLTTKPRKQRNSAKLTLRPRRLDDRREHIPREILREVVAKDGLRCSFVGSDGHRCNSNEALEIDHRDPWARSRDSTAPNLRILCRAHNKLEAERAYGGHKIERSIRRAESPDSTTRE